MMSRDWNFNTIICQIMGFIIHYYGKNQKQQQQKGRMKEKVEWWKFAETGRRDRPKIKLQQMWIFLWADSPVHSQ